MTTLRKSHHHALVSVVVYSPLLGQRCQHPSSTNRPPWRRCPVYWAPQSIHTGPWLSHGLILILCRFSPENDSESAMFSLKLFGSVFLNLVGEQGQRGAAQSIKRIQPHRVPHRGMIARPWHVRRGGSAACCRSPCPATAASWCCVLAATRSGLRRGGARPAASPPGAQCRRPALLPRRALLIVIWEPPPPTRGAASSSGIMGPAVHSRPGDSHHTVQPDGFSIT